MSSATTVRRVVLSIIGVFIAVAVVAGAITVQAAATKPGITVQISPASQSITRGPDATYAVTLTYTGGFTGPVALNATGLPSGSTGTFTNQTGTLTWGLSVPTANTAAGSYSFNVTATSTSSGAKVSGSVTAGLTVNDPVADSLKMSATPASVTMGPGSTAVYTIQLVRTGVTGNVTLRVVSGLPTGAIPTFAPSPTLGDSSILQVTTLETTKDDTYTMNVVASDPVGGLIMASSSVKLVVLTKGKAFTISGSVTDLAPGLTQPLELSLTNPNKKPLSVTNLSVTLHGVTKAAGVPSEEGCDLSDYAVVQYSGPYPLVLPGSSTSVTKTLDELGVVDQTQYPQIQFIDKPTDNQDGCKGATLLLSYSGSAQGN